MDYSPRTIALLTELLHPPVNQDVRPIQKLHNAMFEAGDPDYTSFAVTPQGAILANPGSQPHSVSQAAFPPDRIQFREEHSPLTVEAFAARVERLATALAQARQIPLFVGQQVTLRSLVNPRHHKDAFAFLRQGLLRFDDELEVFGASPNLYGLRLSFPGEAIDPGASGQAGPAAFALRIESYTADPRSLFLEAQATFGPVLATGELSVVAERIARVYEFLGVQALAFIQRFDQPQQA